MFFETHRMMGQWLHERSEVFFPGTLDRAAFVYGNVRPDLMRKGVRDRHLLSDTLSMISLWCGYLRQPSMDPEADATLMGMVCHHVCDAFCRYHRNEEIYTRWGDHFQYEVNMHLFFLESDRVTLLPDAVSHMNVDVGEEVDVLRHVLNRDALYEESNASFSLDLTYALHACSGLMDELLTVRKCRRRQVIQSVHPLVQ